MAFTTPATSVAGTVLTAAFLNTYVRDNIAWMATDSPACRAYHNTTQSIANATPQAVVLNSERFDNAAIHSTSSNTSRLTAPTGGGGKYLFGASWSWPLNAGGTQRQGRVYINGTTIAAILTLQPSASHASEGFITSSYALSAADYMELWVNQDWGAAQNLNNLANYSPEVWMFWFRT